MYGTIKMGLLSLWRFEWRFIAATEARSLCNFPARQRVREALRPQRDYWAADAPVQSICTPAAP
jgi:hypothetical protein